MPNNTLLPNGRWVPAQPMPYFRDTRPVYVKVWHVVLGLFLLFFTKVGRKYLTHDGYKAKKDWYAIEDKLERNREKWMVPVEPYTDEDGNWHSY